VQADLMDESSNYDNYCDSISCLHAIEHFGLGRYNDPIDADGHLKGLNSIHKILKPGGTFYFSTPIGPQRIEFNAHRVFSLAYLLGKFEKDYELIHFSYVDDAGDLYENQALTPQNIQANFNCHYGCGIFELRKK
jgi:SAM-dependent methyltransferase